MNRFVYDIEVFKHYWFGVFKNVDTNEEFVIDNRNDLIEFFDRYSKNSIFFGFNSNWYDAPMLYGIVVKDIDVWDCNNRIITGGESPYDVIGWNNLFYNCDLMSNLTGLDQFSISLKEIEGNLNMNIVECEVDFTIERPLTDEEKEIAIEYCKHDVNATIQLLHKRETDINTVIQLILMYKLPLSNISKTHGSLAAKIMGAKKREYLDELTYDKPDHVTIHHPELEELYMSGELDYTKQASVNIAGIPHILRFGGLHGALEKIYAEGDIWLIDVGSYYPSMMIEYGFMSRSLKSKDEYKGIYKKRFELKAAKDPMQNALKLVLNVTYGAMKSKYNAMYDPKQCNQICITGQLMLVDLIEMLGDSMKLLQTNTDGIIIMVKDPDRVERIVKEWEVKTRMNMEITKVHKLWQKDVNNYILWDDEGKPKVKGGWTNLYGGGSFKKNSLACLHKALVEYFINGVAPRETLESLTDIHDFQQIIKKGNRNFSHVEFHKDGEIDIVQNVNRIYATKEGGSVFKVKNGVPNKIQDTPLRCTIDNDNVLTMDKLDLDWYEERVWERITAYVTETIELTGN